MDEINVNPTEIIIIVATMMESFGWWYAHRVYVEPIAPTWLEVVIGIAGTLAGYSAIIFSLFGVDTKSAIAVALVWYCFFATGKWQVIYQHRKAQDFIEEWRNHRRRNREGDTGPLGESD
jgi:hypothetical protein